MFVVPSKNDVLFGRGNISATHEGNIHFRSIVESRKQEYIEAAWNQKKKIVVSIIRQIQSMDPPGRFLQRDPKFQGVENKPDIDIGGWVQVDEEKAASKVSHCLRERRKAKKGSHENETGDNGIIPLDLIFGQASPCTEDSKFHQGYSNKCSTSPSGLASASESGSFSIHLSSNKNATMSKDSDCDTIPSTFNDNHSQNEINKLFENAANVPLREWIKCAISTTVGSDSSHTTPPFVKLTSSRSSKHVADSVTLTNSYIIPALHIAHSLADQLCDAQESGNYSFLPTKKCDWANRVIVHLETPAARNQAITHPEPSYANDDSSSQDPFHALIDSIALDSSFDRNEISTENDPKEDLKLVLDSMKSIRPVQARLFLPMRGEGIDDQVKTEAQRIYLLGRVFYELFSGGEIPLKIQQKGNFNDENDDYFTSGFIGGLKISVNEDNGRSDHFQVCNRNLTKKSRYHDEVNEKLMEVETLNTRGIPLPLCGLISNMLDAINGDLRKNEAYHRMADVRDDLKLMLDKPSKFLRNPNIEILSKSGVELPDTVYGQHNELKSLQECYNHSFIGNHAFAIIAGPSGTGKSVLANRFADIVVAGGGAFLSGKFDQLQQATPFSALSCAFNEYCNMLIGSVDSQNAVTIASTLREALGQDAAHLIKVVPNLSLIMGDICSVDTEENFVDAMKKLQYLLCRFVEIISNSSSQPIVLFLDDLQWADAASIAVITHILNSSSSPRFLLVGSCRDDEMSDSHPIWNMISTVKKLGVNATIINMQPLEKDLANEMISDTLCLFPRITRPLADVLYHKTKGNPLFLSRLMVSLSRNGMLRFSLCRRRWEWDEEKIQSMKIPDDVAELLTNSIGRLPQDVQDALCTMSCFGASIHIVVIDILEAALDLQLKDFLDMATKEGLLEKSDTSFQFSHDRVQEAAYNMLNSEDRRAKHSRYGLALCIHAMNGCDDSMLFTAVDQINRGDPAAILNPEHRLLVAGLNLRAGTKAMGMSDYVSALKVFEHGISFLQGSHWEQNYDLTLELFNCSTKCAYAVGDQEKLKFCTDEVLAFGRLFEDKLNVLYYLVSALCDASLLNEAITKAIWVLSMLGEDLYRTSSRDEILVLVEETKKMLIEKSDDSLLNYSLMSDSSKIMAMKFLSRLELPLVMTNSDFLPIVVMQMVKMTLAYGMSPMSATGFVYFGSMLASLGQLREGYRFVNLAKKLLHRFGSKEMAGEVIAISSQTIGYIEPMQSLTEFYLEGHTTALKAGDIRSASLNLLLCCGHLVWSGSCLNDAMSKFDEAVRFMKQHNVLFLLFIAETRELDTLVNGFESECFPKPHCSSESYLQRKNPFAAQSLRLQGLTISFIYRDFEATKNAAEKYIGCNVDSWVALYFRIIASFIVGLVSFWIYRQTNSIQWLETGVRMKHMMQMWSETSRWNFLHKFYLLEAEEHFCNNHYECAKLSYDVAISYAERHKFIFDEALASELAGHFAFHILDHAKSLEYFKRAYRKYRDWGAHGKAATLLQYQ